MKICNLKKLLSYIKKQKKRRQEQKYLLPGIELGNFYAPVRLATTTPLLKNYWWYQFISKAFPQNFRQRALYKVDQALLNTNSKILFRRGTTVLTVKTERKRISSHLTNRPQLFKSCMDNAIHRISHYPMHSATGIRNTYPLDIDLSGG